MKVKRIYPAVTPFLQIQLDQEVIDYVVSRYGDFVLLKPPVKGATIPLWLGPILFFIVGMIAIVRHFKKQKKGR